MGLMVEVSHSLFPGSCLSLGLMSRSLLTAQSKPYLWLGERQLALFIPSWAG